MPTSKAQELKNMIQKMEQKIEALENMIKARDNRIADHTESLDSLSRLFKLSNKENSELKIVINYLEQKIERGNN